MDLTDSDNDMLWMEDDPEFDRDDVSVVASARIGIDRVDPEWSKKPLRFYVFGNTSVSKRDKRAEKELDTK